ncbi:MAG: YtxH domain-containing protein [Candidatus Abawacabacteria bacterium]|nr:YtxH domain-containing protein [Candidatus Abawacabacteria bacterium]
MNHNTSVRHVNGVAFGALGLAVATALGAAIGLAFAPQSGAKTRKELWQKAQGLATTFQQSKETVQNLLAEVFGSVDDQLEQAYLEIRGHILAAVDDISDKRQLTQKRFDKIVDDAIAEVTKGKDWAEDQVKALAERLKGEWEAIQTQLK